MMVPRPQPRILLVEENPDLAAPICAILERNGFRCDVAADTSEAMERVELPFVVLIVDLKLDAPHALTFIEWLYATRNHVMGRLIVVSSSEQAGLMEKLESIGICDVVPKPIDAELILRAVYDCLEKTPTFALQ
jgi:DNA-binding response OmpR family regulator